MPTYYKRNVNPTNNNWNQADNWSTVSSTSSTNSGTFPSSTSADPVIFDASSVNVTVNVTSTCTSVNFTGYTNTITMTNNLTVFGAITFASGMSVSGTGSMICAVTATITTNGFVWPNAFNFGTSGVSQVFTLADNMEVNGLVTCVGTTAVTINGAFTLTCNGGLANPTATSGTATIRLRGGNWSGSCNNTLNLDSTGTITLVGNIGRASGTLTYVAGTINNSGNYSLSWSGGSINVDNNIIWNNITVFTATLVSDLYCTGNLITGNGGGLYGPYKLYCGGITQNSTSLGFNGSATVEITGAGAWTGTSVGWGVNLIINCGLNTFTIATNRIFGMSTTTPTLTYTSGTVVVSGLVTFYTCTLATNGITWNNVRMGASSIGGQTITLANNMSITTSLQLQGNGNCTVNGNQINLSGSLIQASTATTAGTTIINMNGTGSISTSGTPVGWTNPITINSVGTITWSGTNTYNGNLTYTAGTIVSTSSILNRTSGTMTINASGFNLNTLNLLGFSQFIGTNGFTIANLNCAITGVHTVWGVGNEYIITTSFNSGQADANSRITYVSHNNAIFTATISGFTMTVSAIIHDVIAAGSEVFGQGLTPGLIIQPYGTAGTTGVGGTGTYYLSASGGALTSRTFVSSPGIALYPKITLQSGATQNVYYTNAIDVDTSEAQTIWSFSGTLLRAANWNQLLPPKTKIVPRIN